MLNQNMAVGSVRAQGQHLRNLLDFNFLFVLAQLEDYRKIDVLVSEQHVSIDAGLAKAAAEKNDTVVKNLKKYQKINQLIAAFKSNQKPLVESLLKEGVDLTQALLLTIFRKDNTTAIRMIDHDAFTPAQSTDQPFVLKQLKENKVLWQALVNHRNDQLRAQCLMFEMAHEHLADAVSTSTDLDYASCAQIFSHLPPELQMHVMEYTNEPWVSEKKGALAIYHLFNAAVHRYQVAAETNITNSNRAGTPTPTSKL